MKPVPFYSISFSIMLMVSMFTIISGCQKDDDANDPGPEQPIIPIVMAHGLVGSGDTYELQILRFASNGYPLEYLHTFEWNTLDLDFQGHVRALDAFIDEVLAKTGFEQVDLVGHSYGTVLSSSYCSRKERAAKVRNLVLIGGPDFSDRSGPFVDVREVRTMNIWSPYDRIVTSGGPIPGATNVELKKRDHFEVASCVESFEAMYRFFRNRPPQTTEIIPQTDPVISGKVLSFAENISGEGATLEIYEVDPATGKRLRSEPEAVFVVNDRNEWGPFKTRSNARYEFKVYTGKPGDRILRFFKEPFIRENRNVIIRYAPPEGSIFKLIFDLIPRDDNLAINVYFNASKAVITGRDQLTVNQHNLADARFANPNYSTVALFMYDVNDNGVSDGTPFPLLREIPAFSLGDFHFSTHPDSTTVVQFNGRRIAMPGSKSQSEGVCIAVFD